MFLGAVGLALVVGAPARADVDEGKARFTPWSGYWWPIRDGRMISGPLTKYDAITGHKAADRERSKSPPGPNVDLSATAAVTAAS